MWRRRSVFAGVLLAAGCGPSVFECSDASECNGGVDGICQPDGYCSFGDPDCETGQRYGAFAGDGLAGECVAPAGTTSSASTTATTSSGTGSSGQGPSDATTGIPEDWWDEAWTVRQRLTLDGSELTEAQIDVPALILLDASRVDLSALSPNGSDLVFVADDNQTVLPHEIDDWADEGPSFVFVRVPEVDGATDIWMYYGSSNAPPAPSALVWDAAYAGIWHLGPTVEDATDPNAPAQVEGTALEPGQIGVGHRFGETEAFIDVGATPRLADLPIEGITVTAWIFADSFGEASSGRVVDKTDAIGPTLGFSFEVNDAQGNSSLQFDRAGVTEGAWRTPEGSISLGEWLFVAATFADESPPSFYVDGVELAAEELLPWTAPADTDAGAPLLIGNEPDSRREFDGILDEVRISAAIRSAEWIELQYRSGADTLVSFGEIERLP